MCALPRSASTMLASALRRSPTLAAPRRAIPTLAPALRRGVPLARRLQTDASAERRASVDFLRERSADAGLRLSRGEIEHIVSQASTEGTLAASEWEALVSRQARARTERVTLEGYLAQSHDLHLGQALLRRTAKLGVAFFAVTGAHAAGACGMHVVGASLVGCVTALGGGTFNNLVAGSAPVGWARDPSFLRVAVVGSLLGFYVWPLAEKALSETARETEATAKRAMENARYALETGALGALAVVGAQQGIIKGFHPVVCCALGVTIAFGGVLRDLMCGKEIALGSASGYPSYGVASLAGAGVYVALREVHVWNCAGSCARLVHGGIPISARILAGFSAACAVRAYAYLHPDAPLLSSMDTVAGDNAARLRAFLGSATT